MTGESRFEGRGRGGGRVLHMLGRHRRIQISMGQGQDGEDCELRCWGGD